MSRFLKAMSVITVLVLSGGCTATVGVTDSTTAISAPVISTSAISTVEKVIVETETTSAVTSAQKVEFIGYDGRELPSRWLEFADDGSITFRCSFGYYDGDIVRLDDSDYINHISSYDEYYTLYKGDDGEYYELGGGYSYGELVLYGTLEYMSAETTDIAFIADIEDNSIPFPYYDNAVQEELIINLGASEDNLYFSKLMENKEYYNGRKFWLTVSQLNIAWDNVNPNKSTAIVKEYKIDERIDMITPKKLDKPIEITLSNEIDSIKLKEEIGYDLDIDLNELFKFNDEYYYEKSIESIKETYSGNMLDDYERRNYLEEMSIISCYLGLPEADWIVCAGYGMYGVQGEFYARFFYIKDGEIIRELTPAEGWVSGFYYDNGELFVSRIDGGLYEFNLESGEMSLIIPDGWGAVSYIDEDYIVFGNDMQKLYIRETGELIETGINWCGLDPSYTFRVEGERIEYIKSHAYGTEEEKYVYDIKMRTLEKDDSLIFERYEVNGHRNSRYKAIVLSSMKNDSFGRIDYDYTSAVKVLDRETNTSKVYNLEAVGHLYIDGDWLWVNERYAVNLITDEIAVVSINEDYYIIPENRTASIWDYESSLYPSYKNYSVEIKYPD